MAKYKLPVQAGVCLILFVAVVASAQTVTSLVSFDGSDGYEPYGPLVQDPNGYLYGVTHAGGPSGAGTVFKASTTGTLTTLYNFTGSSDGATPATGLLLASDGNFYGTTYYGGTSGKGTVFKISPSGTLTTLHSFTGADGANPQTTLVQGAGEVFYGLTLYGGANGDGALFEITSAGTLTLLHSFDGTDGGLPFGLTLASGGLLYGTTLSGGVHGYGTVFVTNTDGSLSTLYSFSGTTDGGLPWTPLLEVSAGVFYGSTMMGTGASSNGTLFSITQDGTLNTLYTFTGGADGESPEQLILGTDGNLYGTAQLAGNPGPGAIFRMTTSGTFTVLYGFSQSDPSGNEPWGGLLEDTDGNFYGINIFGGSGNSGTIYKMSAGLGPFVKTLPAAGKVGATVKILGTDLTGATRVTFNGTPAQFTVMSATEIRATVPSGATSGKARVTTPRGTLVSAGEFRVR